LKRVQIVLLLLILVPAIVNFATPIYNFVDPTLGGLPFFYWFQILMLALSTLPYLAFYNDRGQEVKREPFRAAGRKLALG